MLQRLFNLLSLYVLKTHVVTLLVTLSHPIAIITLSRQVLSSNLP
nr:MAG TPA: hypothetical protein [Caudoviricetes sp.]